MSISKIIYLFIYLLEMTLKNWEKGIFLVSQNNLGAGY